MTEAASGPRTSARTKIVESEVLDFGNSSWDVHQHGADVTMQTADWTIPQTDTSKGSLVILTTAYA